jgi:broad specificity phosphatase PhoE
VEGVTEVLLIRHAQQAMDINGVVGDFIDPPLTEQGQAQAKLLGEALSTKRLDAIYSSPLRRALETARAVQRHHRHLEIEIMDDLREVEVFRDVPRDKTAAEFLGRELLSAVRQRMLDERNWDVYPYSESSYDFRKRSINAVEAAIAGNAGERIAIICHGGVINAYIGHIIGTPYDMFFRPAHTSVNIVVVGAGRRVLRLLNDTHHLTTGEGDFATY